VQEYHDSEASESIFFLPVVLNNAMDDAPSRARAVEEAFYVGVTVNHTLPIFFQPLLPFISVIRRGANSIPHRGGEDDVLYISGTSEFCEHAEIFAAC